MCQCSGLLKEKAGYFERLKIFLKVTGLLGTYDMKSGKWRPFESSTRLVPLTAFGGPWHDGGGRGLGGRCSSESRVSEVKTIEGFTSPLSLSLSLSRPLRVPLESTFTIWSSIAQLVRWKLSLTYNKALHPIPSQISTRPRFWSQ